MPKFRSLISFIFISLTIGALFLLKIPTLAAGTGINVGFTQQLYFRPSNMNLVAFQNMIDKIAAENFSNPMVRVTLDDVDTFPRTNLTTSNIDCNPTQPVNCNPVNLQNYKTAFQYAKGKNIKLFLVTNVPTWAKTFSPAINPWESVYPLATYLNITTKYYSIISNLYNGLIDKWQMFNEGNIHAFDSYTLASNLQNNINYMSSLKKVLIKASATIKLVDPVDPVSTTVGGYPFNNSLYNSWLVYLNIIKGPLDEIGLDMYPDNNLIEIGNITNRIAGVKNAFGKPVMATEIGMCTDIIRFNSNDQGNFIPQYIKAAKNGGASGIFVYQFQDNLDLVSPCENTFGIVDGLGNNKISYPSVISSLGTV